jgi:hypothetical protein
MHAVKASRQTWHDSVGFCAATGVLNVPSPSANVAASNVAVTKRFMGDDLVKRNQHHFAG